MERIKKNSDKTLVFGIKIVLVTHAVTYNTFSLPSLYFKLVPASFWHDPVLLPTLARKTGKGESHHLSPNKIVEEDRVAEAWENRVGGNQNGLNISLRGDIALQVRHIALPHYNDFLIPTNSRLIAENLGRIFGGRVFRRFDGTLYIKTTNLKNI